MHASCAFLRDERAIHSDEYSARLEINNLDVDFGFVDTESTNTMSQANRMMVVKEEANNMTESLSNTVLNNYVSFSNFMAREEMPSVSIACSDSRLDEYATNYLPQKFGCDSMSGATSLESLMTPRSQVQLSEKEMESFLRSRKSLKSFMKNHEIERTANAANRLKLMSRLDLNKPKRIRTSEVSNKPPDDIFGMKKYYKCILQKRAINAMAERRRKLFEQMAELQYDYDYEKRPGFEERKKLAEISRNLKKNEEDVAKAIKRKLDTPTSTVPSKVGVEDKRPESLDFQVLETSKKQDVEETRERPDSDKVAPKIQESDSVEFLQSLTTPIRATSEKTAPKKKRELSPGAWKRIGDVIDSVVQKSKEECSPKSDEIVTISCNEKTGEIAKNTEAKENESNQNAIVQEICSNKAIESKDTAQTSKILEKSIELEKRREELAKENERKRQEEEKRKEEEESKMRKELEAERERLKREIEQNAIKKRQEEEIRRIEEESKKRKELEAERERLRLEAEQNAIKKRQEEEIRRIEEQSKMRKELEAERERLRREIEQNAIKKRQEEEKRKEEEEKRRRDLELMKKTIEQQRELVDQEDLMAQLRAKNKEALEARRRQEIEEAERKEREKKRKQAIKMELFDAEYEKAAGVDQTSSTTSPSEPQLKVVEEPEKVPNEIPIRNTPTPTESRRSSSRQSMVCEDEYLDENDNDDDLEIIFVREVICSDNTINPAVLQPSNDDFVPIRVDVSNLPTNSEKAKNYEKYYGIDFFTARLALPNLKMPRSIFIPYSREQEKVVCNDSLNRLNNELITMSGSEEHLEREQSKSPNGTESDTRPSSTTSASSSSRMSEEPKEEINYSEIDLDDLQRELIWPFGVADGVYWPLVVGRDVCESEAEDHVRQLLTCHTYSGYYDANQLLTDSLSAEEEEKQFLEAYEEAGDEEMNDEEEFEAYNSKPGRFSNRQRFKLVSLEQDKEEASRLHIEAYNREVELENELWQQYEEYERENNVTGKEETQSRLLHEHVQSNRIDVYSKVPEPHEGPQINHPGKRTTNLIQSLWTREGFDNIEIGVRDVALEKVWNGCMSNYEHILIQRCPRGTEAEELFFEEWCLTPMLASIYYQVNANCLSVFSDVEVKELEARRKKYDELVKTRRFTLNDMIEVCKLNDIDKKVWTILYDQLITHFKEMPSLAQCMKNTELAGIVHRFFFEMTRIST